MPSPVGPSTATPRRFVTSDEWFAGGLRIPYDPVTRAVPSHPTPGAVQAWIRLSPAASTAALGARWTTLLGGYPVGSYDYAQAEPLLEKALPGVPKVFVEFLGMGGSDPAPGGYAYGIAERADLVRAVWAHLGIRRTSVVAFDFSTLSVMELLNRQEHGGRGTEIDAVFGANGGWFTDAHTHPIMTTPVLNSALGGGMVWATGKSFGLFKFVWNRIAKVTEKPLPDEQLRSYRDAIARSGGGAFLHLGSGFVDEHKAGGARWDFARVFAEHGGKVRFTVAGSEKDPYEPRQVDAAESRLAKRGVAIRRFPGGHSVPCEHPELFVKAVVEATA
ncbi:epoxide hydrolase mest [Hyaloraphidium curvatum]|nr:epoxide hydrolase mest [Hyaloraphidium curvatum]